MHFLGLPWRCAAIIRSDFPIWCNVWSVCCIARRPHGNRAMSKCVLESSLHEVWSWYLQFPFPVFLDSENIGVVCFTAIDELLDVVRDSNIMENGVIKGSHILARYCELFVCSLSSYGADRQRSRQINVGPLSWYFDGRQSSRPSPRPFLGWATIEQASFDSGCGFMVYTM